MARLLMLAGLLVTASPRSVVPAPTGVPAADLTRTGPQARYDTLRPPEVRLRKLHIVRPDLIPYPIEYEIVC